VVWLFPKKSKIFSAGYVHDMLQIILKQIITSFKNYFVYFFWAAIINNFKIFLKAVILRSGVKN